jgi:hypothetical protein
VNTQPVIWLQVSTVHINPSLQVIGAKMHAPFVELQESAVQAELSLQYTGVSGTQEPFTGAHTSGKHLLVTPVVQSTLKLVAGSEHFVQSGTVVFTHPEEDTQDPVMQPSPVLQFNGVLVHPMEGLQELIVHASSSWQEEEIFTYWQPVAGTHESLVQALLSLQVIGTNKHPVALLQESVVQRLLSLQTKGACSHPCTGSQESTVHARPSSQLIGANRHPPTAWQESAVHALLSLQVILTCWQPSVVLQLSFVQSLLSLQLMGVLLHFVTLLQESRVQALLSLQLTRVYTHSPPEHASLVQASLSLQLISWLLHWLLVRSQESMVQGLLSSQVTLE